MAIAEELAKKQREISISEFFIKNRHLLGFDNPRKALLTTIKEAVDNSLDACEEAKILPELFVEVKQLSEDRFLIVVEDNGPGIVKQQIPKIFAKLLYGSKFHTMKQSRGQQGIGISAAAMYGQLTTGKSTKITSKTSSKPKANYYELHIDTRTNEPEIIKEEIIDWNKKQGTRVELEIEAKYQKGKQSIDDYLRQTAIANPYATIIYKGPEGKIVYGRAINELPKPPKEIKPHPYGIELGMLIKMLKSTKARTLQAFFIKDFTRVSAKVAKVICEKANVNIKSTPLDISREEADRIFKAIKETKIMAPPTNCLSPIGEPAIIKGLQKEIKADFYAAVTRPPSVYRGNPFQVECCTGDSKIYLENGTILPIKEYVENKMFDEQVFSMNDKLKIVPSKVLAIHKFKNKHKIFKITTRTGRSLKLTENNEIPVIENGGVVWKKVGDAMAGEFVATPRIMNVYGKIPFLLDLLNPSEVQIVDNELVTFIVDKLREKYGTYKKSALVLGIDYDKFKAYRRKKNLCRPSFLTFRRMVDTLNLDFDNLKNKISFIRIVDNKFTNPNLIKLPEINEDITYILGLLNSDGYLSCKQIIFVNKDEHLHNLFKDKVKTVFGISVKRKNKLESCLYNKTLYLVLKKIEQVLPRLPDNLIISWLKGFVDGDGWVSLNGNKLKNIGIATAKKEKAEFIQTLLLRLGILSKIEKKKIPKTFGVIEGREIITRRVKYDIIIENLENMKTFCSLISFRQIKRANVLSLGIRDLVKVRSSGDIIPLGNSLKLFREENNLFQYELGVSDQAVRQIEKGYSNVARLNLQQMVGLQEFSGEMISNLRLLAFSDILWDKIVNIELVPHEEYVYDLTVETGNFVADNIVMHNCGVAYGGEIPSEDLIKLMRFANRVPLLYQQSAGSITKAVVNTNWRNYGLSQSRGALPAGPIVLFVHIVSVWVPFTSESKEAIAHYPEIVKQIKLALQDIGRKLGGYIRKNIRAKEQREKANLFEAYIPELASSLAKLSNANRENIEKNLKIKLKKDLPLLIGDHGKEES